MYDTFLNNDPFLITQKCQSSSAVSSVLDNIGTFRHFSRNTPTNNQDKKDFYLLYYRRQNLRLIHKLNQSSLNEDKSIKSVVKQLACCSSHSEVREFENSEAHISKTSKKCKSRYCLICSRIQSNKNTMKFFEKATSDEHQDFFNPRRFYFLTLTVKHDKDTRNDNYLKELRTYITKLTRSKLFKTEFIQGKDKMNFGAIQSIEMTMSADTYHIHSHILICCLPLKRNVADIQTDIRLLWNKLTGDSDQVRLDLVKYNPIQINDEEIDTSTDKLISAVSEVFKYVVKSESMSKMKDDQIDKMAQWIIDTKGKNFINALGYFRTLGLIRRVKEDKNDENVKASQPIQMAMITKTISIEGNAKVYHPISKQLRRQILQYFKITAIVDVYHDVTDIEDQTANIFKTNYSREIDDTFIKGEIATIKRQNAEWEKVQSEDLFGHHFNKNAATNMNREVLEKCPF